MPAKSRRYFSESGTAFSKDGYQFELKSERWRLNKDVSVSLELPSHVDHVARTGFRATLQRYAEEKSARHTENMCTRFKRFVRDTKTDMVTAESILNWRAILGRDAEWHLGGLKGFLIAWHDYGFDGVPDSVVVVLNQLRIKGNRKGQAVTSGCPLSGPLTDLEMEAVLTWANTAVEKGSIAFADYAYLLTLAMTARRPVQIAALKGKDLVVDMDKGMETYRLEVPRCKQRGGAFRAESRSLLIPPDLYSVLMIQWKNSVAALENEGVGRVPAGAEGEVPIFLSSLAANGSECSNDLTALEGDFAQDRLHVTTADLARSLGRISQELTARSERTGKTIKLSATRFRYTRGTKLRREGFGPYVIAELLDHSDIQNVAVYTENTASEASVIAELVGKDLAPFAQACLGKLVSNEREAIRGRDPRSRVPNGRLNAVGSCGSFGFCALGFSACYTCQHFQPWIDGPHAEVLEDLYREKERMRELNCSEVVFSSKDRLILAVEHCVALCEAAKNVPGEGFPEGGDGDHNSH